MFKTTTKAPLLQYAAVIVGSATWLVVSRYLPVFGDFPGLAMLVAMVVAAYACRTGPAALSVVVGVAAVMIVRPAPTAGTMMARALIVAIVGASAVAVGAVRWARREAARQYQVMFEQNPLPMWVYDPTTTAFIRVNDAAVRLYGYSREEFSRMTLRDIRPAEDGPELDESIRHGFAAQSRRTWQHLAKDGRALEVFVRAQSVTLDGRPARLALLEDVSERRDLEGQLRQSQKMEAIGQLAAGIAHDFNNLLAVIQGFATLTLDSLTEEDARRADLEEVVRAGARAADLTRQLLAFSRKQLLQMRVVSVNDVVTEMVPMLRRLVGETIALDTHPSANGRVKADVVQLQQTVMNLVVNARDAMNNEGHITIEVLDVELDAEYCSHHTLSTPGPHVLLAVSDSGAGMDAEIQSRIFEPFFTTKPAGQGTGLGLSTVYGIVKQFGGHLTVYSEVGQGTTFKVYLPRTADALEAPAPQRRRLRASGTRTVLLVDDELGVQNVAARILRRAGYVVHTAGRPVEALKMVTDGVVRPDVLLTDVVLPEMNGQALVDSILPHCPSCKVVFMSGYTEAAAIRLGDVATGATFVSKPFTSAGLTGVLADLFEPHLADAP